MVTAGRQDRADRAWLARRADTANRTSGALLLSKQVLVRQSEKPVRVRRRHEDIEPRDVLQNLGEGDRGRQTLGPVERQPDRAILRSPRRKAEDSVDHAKHAARLSRRARQASSASPCHVREHACAGPGSGGRADLAKHRFHLWRARRQLERVVANVVLGDFRGDHVAVHFAGVHALLQECEK